MDAIKIYEKIMEICKGEDFNEVNTAINFARNKLEQDFYKTQNEAHAKSAYLGAALSVGNYGFPQPEVDRERIVVRDIVREELKAAQEPQTGECTSGGVSGSTEG